MADRSDVTLRLDEASRELLSRIKDAVLIGVIRMHSGSIQLFEGGATDAAAGRFPGHRELLRAGVVTLPGFALGFSMELAAGRIVAFYRNSILNREFDDFAIPDDMMLEVLAAVGLPRAVTFRSYP